MRIFQRTAKVVRIGMAPAVLVTTSLSSSAHANPAALALNLQGAALAASVLGPGSVCTAISYDKNGNRVSVAVGSIGTSAGTWGAGTFGCFVWGQ